MEDPAKIAIIGRPGGSVDLQCGPQKPVKIKVEYTPSAAPNDGMVRVIYFDPEP